jgi:hypothetical protein
MDWARRSRALAAAVLLLGCTHGRGAPTPAASPPARATGTPAVSKPTVAEIVARAARSVVVVQTAHGLGTGFAVMPSVFATNLHVVAGADRILISAPSGRTSDVSAVVSVDPAHDLVLLHAKGATDVPPLALGNDAALRPGDGVIALGTPQGLDLSVSTGVVGAVREVNPELTLLQITAPISPGSSGGPLFDDSGRVVGVTTMFSAQGQNLNFAVPAHYVAALVARRGQPMSMVEFSKLRFRAAKGDGNAPREGGSTAQGKRPPFPETIAGFGMGWTLKAAKAACPGKFKEAANLAECSHAPVRVPFASGPVRLSFAQGRIVSVGLLATSLDDVGTVLSVKYGPADRSYKTSAKVDPKKHPRGVRIEWRLEGGNIVVSAETGHRPYVNYVSAVWNEENNY